MSVIPQTQTQQVKPDEVQKFNGDLPQGVIGWVLWSLPKSVWRYVIWMIALFIALTGAVAFYQLSTIRSSEMEQARLVFFREQWQRSTNPEWKVVLLNTWSKPGEIIPEIWAGAANHKHSSVRMAVALHPQVPRFYLEQLTSEQDIRVRLVAILSMPSRSKSLRLLAKDNIEVRRLVADAPKSYSETLELLSEDLDESVKELVAKNPSTPAKVLKLLDKNGNENIKNNVATNPSTSAKHLELLAKENENVQLSVAKNPSTPAKTLKLLLSGKNKHLQIKQAVAGNPSTAENVLEFLAKNKDMKISVAGNPSTPAKTLKLLSSKNTDWYIKRAVARNPSTSASL